MLISSRRLLWGLNCLLLLAAAVIFRPVRSWIDQTIVAMAIHPDIHVQEIQLHSGKIEAGLSLVEAKQFDWTSSHGNRSFGISAQLAWFVVENESLIDKAVSIPRALLQQSKLYLETIPEKNALAANSADVQIPGSLWQQQLNSRFGELEWNDLRQHFDGLLKLDDFSAKCNNRIDAWVIGTEKIVSDAKLLGLTEDILENPLRDDSDLQSRLDGVEQLVSKEAALRNEMSSIDLLVKSKLDQIGDQFKSHSGLIQQKAHAFKEESKQQYVAEALEQAGGRILSQFKSFGEVADLLCRASTLNNGFVASENYRAPGREVLHLEQLMATGVFAYADDKFPFRMQSQCSLTSKSPFGSVARANFRYQFDVRPFTVKLVSSSRVEQPDIVDLQMQILPLKEPAIDMSVKTQPEIDLGSAQWVIGSNGQTIAGELYVDQTLIPIVLERNAAWTKAAAKQLEAAEGNGQALDGFVFEIGGTWNSPTWKVSGPAPAWLESAIDGQLEQQVLENEKQLVAKLEEHVGAEIDKLGNLLSQRLDLAHKKTEGQAQTLVAIRNSIKEKLNSVSNTEFARSKDNQEIKR
jgi:hypothetical protein